MSKIITPSLFLALLLSSCCTPPPPKIEFREVYIDRTVRLDPGLTTPPEFPAPPSFACSDPRTGQSTLCEEQVHEWLGQIAAAARQAISQLREIDALQPQENEDE